MGETKDSPMERMGAFFMINEMRKPHRYYCYSIMNLILQSVVIFLEGML